MDLPRSLLFTPAAPPRPFANDTFGLSPDQPPSACPLPPLPPFSLEHTPSSVSSSNTHGFASDLPPESLDFQRWLRDRTLTHTPSTQSQPALH